MGQENNQLKISKYLIKLCYQVMWINFIFSVIYWILFTDKGSFGEIFEHWGKYIILPLVIVSFITYIGSKLIHSNKFNMAVKKYINIILMIYIAATLAMIHDVVFALMLGFMVPIFVSTLYSDTKLTTITYIIAQVVMLAIAVYMFFLSTRDYGRYLFTETLVSSGILLVSYMMSKVIIYFNQSQIMSLEIMFNDKMVLEGKVNFDALTNLYNRRSFDQHFNQTFNRTKLEQSPIGLALIDIDDFKQINDTRGHAAGDSVLIEFSRILLMHQSDNIHAFRIGGDEFGMIFENHSKETCENIYANITDRISSISSDNSAYSSFTVSCGIAVYEDYMTDNTELFKAADEALYKAKQAGKNQIRSYK